MFFDDIMAAHQAAAAVPSPVMNSTASRRPAAPKQEFGLDVWQPREKVRATRALNSNSHKSSIPSGVQYCAVVMICENITCKYALLS